MENFKNKNIKNKPKQKNDGKTHTKMPSYHYDGSLIPPIKSDFAYNPPHYFNLEIQLQQK